MMLDTLFHSVDRPTPPGTAGGRLCSGLSDAYPSEMARVTAFTERVVAVIRSITRGRVMTYGSVATAAGSPRGARGVAWILHSSSDASRLPWHRVVGRGGRIALDRDRGGDLQRTMLEAEGIDIGMDGCVDLGRYEAGGSAAGATRPRAASDAPPACRTRNPRYS